MVRAFFVFAIAWICVAAASPKDGQRDRSRSRTPPKAPPNRVRPPLPPGKPPAKLLALKSNAAAAAENLPHPPQGSVRDSMTRRQQGAQIRGALPRPKAPVGPKNEPEAAAVQPFPLLPAAAPAAQVRADRRSRAMASGSVTRSISNGTEANASMLSHALAGALRKSTVEPKAAAAAVVDIADDFQRNSDAPNQISISEHHFKLVFATLYHAVGAMRTTAYHLQTQAAHAETATAASAQAASEARSAAASAAKAAALAQERADGLCCHRSYREGFEAGARAQAAKCDADDDDDKDKDEDGNDEGDEGVWTEPKGDRWDDDKKDGDEDDDDSWGTWKSGGYGGGNSNQRVW